MTVLVMTLINTMGGQENGDDTGGDATNDDTASDEDEDENVEDEDEDEDTDSEGKRKKSDIMCRATPLISDAVLPEKMLR